MKFAKSEHAITLDDWKKLVSYEIHKINPNLTKEDWEEIEEELSLYSEESKELVWWEVAGNMLL